MRMTPRPRLLPLEPTPWGWMTIIKQLFFFLWHIEDTLEITLDYEHFGLSDYLIKSYLDFNEIFQKLYILYSIGTIQDLLQ